MAFSKIKPKITINFDDLQAIFRSKSSLQLIKSLLVFSACKIPILVNKAEIFILGSKKLFGVRLTDRILKETFFSQFCAGEDEQSIKPTVSFLESAGIGSILDYAAESDLITMDNDEGRKAVQCRIYDYQNEELCDFHQSIFAKCIKAVKSVSPTGFAAIKCTALGNPDLLKRVSITITELRRLFLKLDPKNTGYVNKESFSETFATLVNGKDALPFFEGLDIDNDGKIDYIEWSNGLDILQLHLLTQHCTVHGPLFASQLNDEERILFARMKDRLRSLAALARTEGVRLMIDAEQSYFQPAIDNLTVNLSREFNAGGQPVVFSTYQMYLRGTSQRLRVDLDRARKGGYTFAAKLVRGAYMELERTTAERAGEVDPIHPSLEATHAAYDEAVKEVIARMKDSAAVEVMIATHNQASVESALLAMQVGRLYLFHLFH